MPVPVIRPIDYAKVINATIRETDPVEFQRRLGAWRMEMAHRLQVQEAEVVKISRPVRVVK